MNKKKILMLVPLPPPTYGAAVSSNLIVNSEYINENFNIQVIKVNYSEKFEDIGHLNYKKIKGFFKTNVEIAKKIRSFKPDFVYFVLAPSGAGFLRDFFFIFNCKLFNKKIIYHLRAKGVQHEIKTLTKKIMYRFIFKNSKFIILDKSQFSDISQLVNKKDIFILPNAIKNEISENQFQTILKQRKARKILNILFLSNMDETKGPFKLLEACNILKQKNIKFKCNFVGSWPDKETETRFLSYIENNKLQDNVVYLGRKTGKEKNNILSKSDIMVFPTEYKKETFGLVILEAMQHGLAVIANNIAAIPTTIQHNKTGFVLKNNSTEEIAKYLTNLFKNKKKTIGMGNLGRKRFIEEYSFDKYEPKLTEILKTIK